MANSFSYIVKWVIGTATVLPFLFAATNGLYIGIKNQSLELQLDPLVIQIFGPYDSLIWPLPLYFLIVIIGGFIGLMLGISKTVIERRNRLFDSSNTSQQ